MMGIKELLKINIDQNRIYGLDILRALAILFVVLGHGNIFYVPGEHHIQYILELFVFDGVSLFFVLSGFLIGGILIKIIETKDVTIPLLFNFWKRRWFRTLPNYYVILLLLVILIPYNKITFVIDPIRDNSIIKYIFFLQNFNSPAPSFFSESWSLCVEEWFYLIIPSLIFFLIGIIGMRPKKSVITVSALVIILVTIYRYYKYISLPHTSGVNFGENFIHVVLSRLDSLIYGLIGAYLSFYHKLIWNKNKKLCLIAGILIIVMERCFDLFIAHNEFGFYKNIFSFSVTSLGMLLLMPFMSQYKKGKGFFYKILTYISLISYSMYLLNLSPVIFNIIPFITKYIIGIHMFVIIRYVLYWLITVIGSVLLYKCVERPFMRLRERFT